MSVFSTIRPRQTTDLLKHLGRDEISDQPLEREGLGEVLWLCLHLNRAKSTFKWVLKGPGYLSLHANFRLIPSLFI